MSAPAALRAAFNAGCGRPAAVAVRAPGRINLIGEHVDYNGGPVLPMAIERALWLLAAPRDDGVFAARSLALDASHSGTRDALPVGGPWCRQLAGALAEADPARRLGGLDLLIGGDLPVGGGLSSSAALSVAALTACTLLCGDTPDRDRLPHAARRIEHDWLDMPCGLMDPMVVTHARAGHACLIDCADGSLRHLPFTPPAPMLVVDSGQKHALADGAYAERRRSCERAAQALGCSRLVDAGAAFAQRGDRLRAADRSCARHVLAECDRVRAAAAALARQDWPALGALLLAGHAGLRDDFAVSTPEVDALVERLQHLPEVLGARMTGGGFGGSVIALCSRAPNETQLEATLAAQAQATGLTVDHFSTAPAAGLQWWRLA